jgi:hypothetical protein
MGQDLETTATIQANQTTALMLGIQDGRFVVTH